MAKIKKRTWTTKAGKEKTAWAADYFDGAGKRRLKTFATKKEADAWLVGARGEIAQGTHTPSCGLIQSSIAAGLGVRRSGPCCPKRRHGSHVSHLCAGAQESPCSSRIRCASRGCGLICEFGPKPRSGLVFVRMSLKGPKPEAADFKHGLPLSADFVEKVCWGIQRKR